MCLFSASEFGQIALSPATALCLLNLNTAFPVEYNVQKLAVQDLVLGLRSGSQAAAWCFIQSFVILLKRTELHCNNIHNC